MIVNVNKTELKPNRTRGFFQNRNRNRTEVQKSISHIPHYRMHNKYEKCLTFTSEYSRLQTIINKAARYGFLPTHTPSVSDLFQSADQSFFQ